MSIDYLFTDPYLANRLAELNDQHRRIRRQIRRNRRATVALVEEDLGQVALLLRGVAELCIDKGIFSAEELAAKLREVDIADGVQDERLDADVVMPGARKLADLEPLPVVRKSRKRRRRKR